MSYSDFYIAVIILDYCIGYEQDEVDEDDEDEYIDEDQGDGGYELPCSNRDFYGDL